MDDGLDAVDILSLDGQDWLIREESASNKNIESQSRFTCADSPWIRATVPGNIQDDLEAAHLLSPLHYGMGDDRLSEVARRNWWYKKEFFVPACCNHRQARLYFLGVDDACQIFLNDHLLGSHTGMFKSFSYAVESMLNVGGLNTLRVKIHRMPEKLVPFLVNSDDKDSGMGSNDYFVNGINQTRQELKDLKSPTNFGWDFGFNIWTLGIWKSVFLDFSGVARIDWIQVRTELNDTCRHATINVRVAIDCTSPVKIQLVLYAENGVSKTGKTVCLLASEGCSHISEQLHLEDPYLWWPNAQGEQPLYQLTACIAVGDDAVHSHERHVRFGIRDIRWEQVDSVPEDYPNPQKLVINGRPVRIMGTNMLPPDLLFGRIGKQAERILVLAQKAGINTIRLWGGGVILPDELYSLADERGIMISQEMPLASCLPEKDAVFLHNLGDTVRNIIQNIRNHPSIIEWTGGSEMLWVTGTKHPALQLIESIVRQEDDRIFRATSAVQGTKHGPHYYQHEHHYRYYNSPMKDAFSCSRMIRYGEFGCQSPANLEVWQQTIPLASQSLANLTDDPVLIRKNVYHALNYDYWLSKKEIDSLFGALSDLENIVQAGQFLGAEGLRYAIQALRIKGNAIGGFTAWSLNEPWPNGAGSFMIDYAGRPLMNYDFVRQALAPVSLVLLYDSIIYDPLKGIDAELALVHDGPVRMEGLQWLYRIRDRFGSVIHDEQGSVSIDPRKVVFLGPLTVKESEEAIFYQKIKPSDRAAAGPLFIELSLRDRNKRIIHESLYTMGAAGIEAPFKGLLAYRKSFKNNKLAAGDIEDISAVSSCSLSVSVDFEPCSPDCECACFTIKNHGRMTALFIEPKPMLAYRTDLMIENNHIFIPPGEYRNLLITAPITAECGLTLAQTGWIVTCWNADNITISPSDDVLLAMGRRDFMCREYAGYGDQISQDQLDRLKTEDMIGHRIVVERVPFILQGNGHQVMHLEFHLSTDQSTGGGRLRIHTSDQSAVLLTNVLITLNGRSSVRTLPLGLGRQKERPSHLAYPCTLSFMIPAGVLIPGTNSLDIAVDGDGWFTWDALDLIRIPL